MRFPLLAASLRTRGVWPQFEYLDLFKNQVGAPTSKFSTEFRPPSLVHSGILTVGSRPQARTGGRAPPPRLGRHDHGAGAAGTALDGGGSPFLHAENPSFEVAVRYHREAAPRLSFDLADHGQPLPAVEPLRQLSAGALRIEPIFYRPLEARRVPGLGGGLYRCGRLGDHLCRRSGVSASRVSSAVASASSAATTSANALASLTLGACSIPRAPPRSSW